MIFLKRSIEFYPCKQFPKSNICFIPNIKYPSNIFYELCYTILWLDETEFLKNFMNSFINTTQSNQFYKSKFLNFFISLFLPWLSISSVSLNTIIFRIYILCYWLLYNFLDTCGKHNLKIKFVSFLKSQLPFDSWYPTFQALKGRKMVLHGIIKKHLSLAEGL